MPARHLLLGQAIYVTMSIFAVLLFFIANYIWIILSTSASHFLSSINKTPYLENLYQLAVNYTRSQPINFMSLLVLIGFLSGHRQAVFECQNKVALSVFFGGHLLCAVDLCPQIFWIIYPAYL